MNHTSFPLNISKLNFFSDLQEFWLLGKRESILVLGVGQEQVVWPSWKSEIQPYCYFWSPDLVLNSGIYNTKHTLQFPSKF